jgi:hypothetical protein
MANRTEEAVALRATWARFGFYVAVLIAQQAAIKALAAFAELAEPLKRFNDALIAAAAREER